DAVCRPLGRGCRRLPPQGGFNLEVLAVEAPDIDALFVIREGNEAVAAAAVDLDHKLDELFKADGLVAAEVEDLALALVRDCREKQGVDDIVDVVKVPDLAAISEQGDLRVLDDLADEPAHESLARMFDQLAWSEGVSEPE